MKGPSLTGWNETCFATVRGILGPVVETVKRKHAQGVAVKKLRRSNLSEDAYTTVKELLLAGKRYEPGAKISVEELSRQLGVSRTPIWGAIYRLEAEGIVQILPRQGVYLLNF
jgi:DNA-binding GntR family transcriptional regulator